MTLIFCEHSAQNNVQGSASTDLVLQMMLYGHDDFPPAQGKRTMVITLAQMAEWRLYKNGSPADCEIRLSERFGTGRETTTTKRAADSRLFGRSAIEQRLRRLIWGNLPSSAQKHSDDLAMSTNRPRTRERAGGKFIF